jgi:KDO2-lipid IV(A) lauroyltransferase
MRPADSAPPLSGAGAPTPDPAPAVPPGPVPRRWHRHSFNRRLSWELIDRITPRLPRLLLVPLHHVTSAIFFLALSDERAAARRNLRRVTGRTGWANLRLAYRLFHNFSRVMVAYGELRRLAPEQVAPRIDGADETAARIQALLDERRGLIIASAHLGHYDLGVKLLGRFDRPVHLVMHTEDAPEVARFVEEARRIPDLHVHQTGRTPLLAVELMLALRRGEIVTIQVDRTTGNGALDVPFFGAPAPLPSGPVRLALATGAPILPVFVLLAPGERYRLLGLEPLRFAVAAEPPDEARLRGAARALMARLEPVIAAHPDQWFNFYDVWPCGRRRSHPGSGIGVDPAPAGGGP